MSHVYDILEIDNLTSIPASSAKQGTLVYWNRHMARLESDGLVSAERVRYLSEPLWKRTAAGDREARRYMR